MINDVIDVLELQAQLAKRILNKAYTATSGTNAAKRTTGGAIRKIFAVDQRTPNQLRNTLKGSGKKESVRGRFIKALKQ